MSAAYNDNTVQYGSRVWVLLKPASTTRGTYVCDNITINRPTAVIERTDQLGEPSGSVGVPKFVTGSATLQLSSSSVDEPQVGDVIACLGAPFNAVLDTTIGAEAFYVKSVDRVENKDAEKKINITIIKKYGA